MCWTSVGSWVERVERHLARFARHGERRLPFEIEMLLAADGEGAVEPARRRGERALHVAAAVGVIGLHARAGLERVGDGQRRLLFLDVDLGQAHGAARRVAGRRRDGEQRLAVEQDLAVGEQAARRRIPARCRSCRECRRRSARRRRPRRRARRRGRGRAACHAPCRPCRRRDAACPAARGCRRHRPRRR